MTVQPLVPDIGVPQAPQAIPLPQNGFGEAQSGDLAIEFGDAMNQVTEQFDKAQTAERRFVGGTGSLQEMVFERAQADALLEVATASTSKVSQQLNSILNMQV